MIDPNTASEVVSNLHDVFMRTLVPIATGIGLKVIGAVLFWVIGRQIIHGVVRLLDRTTSGRSVEPTVARYLSSMLSVVLTMALVVAIAGFMGIETATFAALMAGAGLAIGTAWGDMLKNFAAGVFMLVLRPFKVGDFVTVGGVTGTVVELGIFVCTINTPDNVRTVVGNTKIFGDTIQNFTANPTRRVELVAQLAGSTDPRQVIEILQRRIRTIANVAVSPAPEIHILTFNPMGPVLSVRPYCHNDHYWQVYFDTNNAIQEELTKGGFATPAPLYHLKQL